MKSAFVVISCCLALCGCARIATSKAEGPMPKGLRVYPPQVLFLVDAEYSGGKGRTSIVLVPNLGEAYDIRPVTCLAKNDLKIELEDGMVKTLASSADTTAILSFFGKAGELAAQAAGKAVAARDLEGSYGLPTGIYVLRPDGSLAPMPKPAR